MNTSFFSRCLLLFAGFILCLHSIIPHVHESENIPDRLSIQVENERCTNGLLTLLRDFVDFDLGENHLEHFSLEQDNDFLGFVAGPILLAVIPPTMDPADEYGATPISQGHCFCDRYYFFSALYYEDEAPRGPPVLA